MTGILIDADIFLFRASSGSEVEIDWGDGIWTLHSEPARALNSFNEEVVKIADELNASEIVLCFSDPTRRCFRHDLSPLYKANRKDTRKPLAYRPLRELIVGESAERGWKIVTKPRLEADDVMGIVSTRAPGRYIIVSADKDLKTIPGKLYRNGELLEISEREADYWHLYQTLTGDVTDGYTGCPGVGPETANAALINPQMLSPRPHTITRGPRKGQVEQRWEPVGPCSPWHAVVSQYRKAGLTEDDALLQARFARILRASDWDFDKSEVRLWTP